MGVWIDDNKTMAKVTIIICSGGRKESLVKCLDSLQQMSYKDYVIDIRDEKDDLVKIRKTAGSMMVDPHLIELRERACFILENNLPVKHAVKGGKRYSILPMGSSTVVECDERNLLTPKKKGKTK